MVSRSLTDGKLHELVSNKPGRTSMSGAFGRKEPTCPVEYVGEVDGEPRFKRSPVLTRRWDCRNLNRHPFQWFVDARLAVPEQAEPG